MNKTAERLFDIRREDVLGLELGCLFAAGEISRVSDELIGKLRANVASGSNRPRTSCGRRRRGREFPISWTYLPVAKDARAGTQMGQVV